MSDGEERCRECQAQFWQVHENECKWDGTVLPEQCQLPKPSESVTMRHLRGLVHAYNEFGDEGPETLGAVLGVLMQHADAFLCQLSSEPVPQSPLLWSCDINRPDDLRAKGWVVAAHNDYRQNGESFTFWLLTKDGRALKGEGRTDGEALDRIRVQVLETYDGKD